MTLQLAISLLLLLIAPCIGAVSTSGTTPAPIHASPSTPWQTLAPGLEFGTFSAAAPPATDGAIRILRIDPSRWDFDLVGLSSTGETGGRTAREWCSSRKLTAAINAGMFGTDQRTHVGYMRASDHLNSGQVNGYQSVAAFDPKPGRTAPGFRIFDLDAPGVKMESILRDYGSVVQNLRLIRRPGLNRWARQEQRWSEAALGEDASGRALFIFCRAPLTMRDLNRRLLSLGIGLVAAQHLEGGPEAQLYLRVGEVTFEGFGSFETGFQENDSNAMAWPIPNVLGIRPR